MTTWLLLLVVVSGVDVRYVDRPEFHGLTYERCLHHDARKAHYLGGVRFECVVEGSTR